MKFYRDKNNTFYFNKIKNNNLTCVYCDDIGVDFFKNGKNHNTKNTAYIHNDNKFKEFCLNGKYYGDQNDFNKKSWRKFVKLQAFL